MRQSSAEKPCETTPLLDSAAARLVKTKQDLVYRSQIKWLLLDRLPISAKTIIQELVLPEEIFVTEYRDVRSKRFSQRKLDLEIMVRSAKMLKNGC